MYNNIKISSIIIAKDEEANIERCLNSQAECIDEIIVIIDSASKDRTLDIIRSYPAIKYKILDWKGYSETKKAAVSLTSNEWILWIDADEEISENLRREILEFKKSSPVHNSYSIPRQAYFLGKWITHSGWYPGRVVRLFNKNMVQFNSSNVHEGLELNGSTGELQSDLRHYTDPSIKHYFEKFNKYTSLAAHDMAESGKKFHITDLLLRPAAIFIKMYFIKRGFLDGIQGFILAAFSSAYVFTKYSKLWELKSKDKKNDTR